MELRSRERGEIVDGIQGKFCKKVLRIPRNAAKREAENEFGRDSMRDNILCAAIKYWTSLKKSARAVPVRLCYDWQVGQPKVECWTGRLRGKNLTVSDLST
jgi:hypothetical protein